jgi:hypothetical protein
MGKGKGKKKRDLLQIEHKRMKVEHRREGRREERKEELGREILPYRKKG